LNKLITSLACGTVLSMSLLGAGNAANAAGTGGGMGSAIPDTGATGTRTERIRETNGTGSHMMNGTDTRMMNQQGNTMMNQTTGTMRKGETILKDAVRTGENNTVSPLSTTPTGRYRATSTTTNNTDNDNGSNWGWLGLIGLLGLAGMRSRSGERDRH
jgi:MYXO-CTERM domain-containing protein